MNLISSKTYPLQGENYARDNAYAAGTSGMAKVIKGRSPWIIGGQDRLF